jgi:dihydrofolate synthase / folylpolyglutamate synthase
VTDFRAEVGKIFESLVARIGERSPQPRLHATRKAVEYLGNPQQMYSIVHITGTNGKTSTARMIEALCRAHGLRTGLMTSPHLRFVNERIVIDGKPIGDEQFVDNWRDVEPYIQLVDSELVAAGEMPLTYFETLTVLTLAAFADAPVDVAILEVGMGGEWDSTNVADADVAVFTPIGIDHAEFLGDTVAKIARTKAGIIKPGSIVVTATQEPDALAEIVRAADKFGDELFVEGDDFELKSNLSAVGGQVLQIRGRASAYRDVPVTLHGAHQAHNAALAIAAVESLFGNGSRPIPDEILSVALGNVTSPGRLQYLAANPPIIVDAAHNPHGAQALATAISDVLPFEKVWVVLGVLEDKDSQGIIEALDPVVAGFVCTQSGSDRATQAHELADTVSALVGPGKVHAEPTLASAIETAKTLCGPGDAIMVTGSITLVGDAITLARTENWT